MPHPRLCLRLVVFMGECGGDSAGSRGTQCGFCTLGLVMIVYSLLENNSHLPPELVEQIFDGNLSRCADYRPILLMIVL